MTRGMNSWPVLIEGEFGSVAHGLGSETSDHDLMRVCVEPPAVLYGVEPASSHERLRPVAANVKTPAGETEVTVYGLRTFVARTLDGDPTCWTLLHTPILTRPDIADLQGAAWLFRTRKALTRMGRVGNGVLRTGTRVLRDSPNTPNASKTVAHGLRILAQAVELARTGGVELPIPDLGLRDELRAIRGGTDPSEAERLERRGAALRAELEHHTAAIADPDPRLLTAWLHGVYDRFSEER